MSEPIHIISLGAGVQSSTMALMAAAGEITPMPAAAIFADTQDEPESVYRWLDWLEKQLPFPVHRVSKGKLSENIVQWGFSQIPSFVDAGIGKRQCTMHYKIMPIQKKIRELLGVTGKRTDGVIAVLWIGISLDEIGRMKPSRERWVTNRHPLIESYIRRSDCIEWLLSHDYPVPPKSACVFCPYRTPLQWKMSKASGGPEWEKIVKVSNILAARGEYLTPECVPIEKAVFDSPLRDGQILLDGFGNECEGMCGV